MRQSRLIRSAAVSAVAVLTLSGCNGAEESTAVDQLSPVATIEKVADTASNDSATYTFELAGTGVSVKGSGAYRGGADPAAQMVFDSMKVLGFSAPAGTEFRFVDDVMYLKSAKGGLLPGVGDGEWVKLPMDDVKSEGNDFGSLDDLTMTNPADELKKMLDTQDVTKVGTETIDGVKTTHYRANVDSTGSGTVTEKKSSTHSNELSSELEEQLENSIKSSMGLDKPVTVDAWVDSDYHARKLRMTLPFLGEMTMTMKFADFGDAVNIEAPTGATEMDFSDLLGSELGDALGENFSGQLGQNFDSGDLSKQMEEYFGGSGSSGLPDDFEQRLQEQIEKSLKDHGVTSTT